jgi:protein O-mannosyl-transferase
LLVTPDDCSNEALAAPAASGKERTVAAVLIIIITVAVYLPIINQDFANWDDPKHIKAIWKPSLERAWRIVTDFDLKYTNVAYYHPLHFLSLMADQALLPKSNEPQPWIAKMMNVVYHVLNVLLVFYLLTKVGAGRKAALIGALIFGVHPIQVGTVAWIAERKTLLCTLFYLSALVFFLRFLDTGKLVHAALVAFCFVAGLLSKPLAVTLPVTMAAWLLVMPGGKGKSTWSYTLIALLVVLAGVWGAYVTHTEMSYPGVLPPLEYRPLLAAGAIWFYVSKFLYPTELVPVYPRWNVIGEVWVFAGLFGALVFMAGVITYFRKRIEPVTLWGLLFFLINLLPVVGLVPFGYMGHSFVGDHFMYLPIVGLAIVVARTVQTCVEKLGDRNFYGEAFTAVLYVLVCVLALLAVKQTLLWRDSGALWEATLKVTKTSAAAYSNYGIVLNKRGEYKKALQYLTKAVELSPMDSAYVNLGGTYQALGDKEKAWEMFSKAVELNPENSGARIMLAAMLREQGKVAEAAKFLEESIKLFPRDPWLRADLGISYRLMGDTDKATREWEKANELDPLFPSPYIHRASVLLSHGENVDLAVSLLKRALALAVSPEAHRLLGLAYARKGLAERSLEEFLKAYNLQPNLPGLRDNIATLLLNLGQTEAAEELCSEADQVGKSCSDEVRKRLKAAAEKRK